MASHIENCSMGYENELNECQKVIETQKNDNHNQCRTEHFLFIGHQLF